MQITKTKYAESFTAVTFDTNRRENELFHSYTVEDYFGLFVD